nr:PHP domain-containing protein [Bacillus pacificus]
FGICDLVLLAENNQGYQNIVKLVSKAYQEADRFGSIPLIPKFWLSEVKLESVICLNGGQQGELGKAILAKDYIKADEIIKQNIEIFGTNNYIIEIHKLEYENEGLYNEKALEYASKYNLIAVATNLT